MAKKIVKTTTSLTKVSLNSPQALANFANTLKEFIVKRDLYTNIKGKNYVHVEAWEFAGACMGIAPIVREVSDLTNEKEVKHKARVELVVMSSGKVIGAGEALCSSKENNKLTWDEYAIASMAQTRAVGKAFRNSFAWVMKMAGYEAATAEEMDEKYVQTQAEPEVLEPLEQVQQRVEYKLASMATADKIRSIKESTRKVVTKNLTETEWRRLDLDLQEAAKQKPAEETGQDG